MKNVFRFTTQFAAAVALTFIFAQSSEAAPSKANSPTTKDVVVSLNEVYVPGGFDSSADAYVVATGLFPNGCYNWKGADVKHVDSFNHEIQSIATVSQGMCIMVLVPFTKEIRVGQLASGVHTLKFMNGDGTYLQKSMKIE